MGKTIQPNKKPEFVSFERQQPEVGAQLGILLHFIRLGVHETKFGPKDLVRLVYELPHDVMKEGPQAGKPLVISEEVPVSLTDEGAPRQSKLRERANALMGKPTSGGVNFSDLIGKGLQLILIERTSKSTGRKYVAINNTAPVSKGTSVPGLVNEPLVLDDLDNPDEEVLKKIREGNMKWIADKIRLPSDF